MGVYHQMGHDSWNLIDQEALSGYRGIILSPVNTSPHEVPDRLAKLKDMRGRLDVVLDPQLYKPASNRGRLDAWPHCTKDLDTADLSDLTWWSQRCHALLETAARIGADSVCSPASVPRHFDDAYYQLMLDVAELVQMTTSEQGMSTLLTAIVRLNDLGSPDTVNRLATILTRSKVRRVYLVLHDDLPPRKQRTDYKALAGAVLLISYLETAGLKVLVGFSGLDMLLWKSAGASDVATGKFFNLRRFDPSRWDSESEGGKLLPYWTEQSLISWLREEDLKLLLDKRIIDRAQAEEDNPYARDILDAVTSGTGVAWIALAWRQYLYWFQQAERDFSHDPTLAEKMLLHADGRWAAIEDAGILLFERGLDGSWIRPWINALREARRIIEPPGI